MRIRLVAVVAAAVVVLGTVATTVYDRLTEPTAAFDAVTLHDPDDDHQVAAAADDVWHGTVRRRLGMRTIAGIPSQLYEVKVGRVFKGGLTGVVTVTQTADDPPLDDEHSYVFATVPWREARDGHAVLAEARPRSAEDLAAPAPDRAAGEPADSTVGDHWTWVSSHLPSSRP
ncbi:hypothetical protein GCM10010387_03950 [Streptomyces inusitatus]|uniref:Uncharacterized protein n=1 Tax=Streptomyces inusitatus TaxID=68221 RepID=A0A918PLB3_9ACTN|nr:hypothetical protein [Streptomyces inusitatus]GGZ14910.1 hypothetical protein GCM10010387_03950 [Streptomyces inusitatus]